MDYLGYYYFMHNVCKAFFATGDIDNLQNEIAKTRDRIIISDKKNFLDMR